MFNFSGNSPILNFLIPLIYFGAVALKIIHTVKIVAQNLLTLWLDMIIIEFYQYLYYRTCHALLHFGWPREDVFKVSRLGTNASSYAYLNFATILFILLYFTIGEIPKEKIWYIILICCLISIWFMDKVLSRSFDEELYEELNQRYENEKHRVIKGTLVALFYIFTMTAFMGSLFLVFGR